MKEDITLSDLNLNSVKIGPSDLDKKKSGTQISDVKLSDFNLGKKKKIIDPNANLKYDSLSKAGKEMGFSDSDLENSNFRRMLRHISGYKSIRKGITTMEALTEKHMTDSQKEKKEEIAKAMKDSPEKVKKLKDKYGDEWLNHVYAIATSQAMKEEVENLDEKAKSNDFNPRETKTNKIEKHIKSLGWKKIRDSGGHTIYGHPKADHRLALAHQPEQSIGVAKETISKASMLKEELTNFSNRGINIIKEIILEKATKPDPEKKSKLSTIKDIINPSKRRSSNKSKNGEINHVGGKTLYSGEQQSKVTINTAMKRANDVE